MDKRIKILGIAGSLRKNSFNKAVLDAARALAPETAVIETFDIAPIPLFNQDQELKPPRVIVEFKQLIRASDAILFVTPEYNYSIPGVLKNAIDWASRPYGDNAWDDKPAAIMGATGGLGGTMRAQYHLRQMFVFLNVHALNKPEVQIPKVTDKLDKEGKITDEQTRRKIREQLDALVAWTRRLAR